MATWGGWLRACGTREIEVGRGQLSTDVSGRVSVRMKFTFYSLIKKKFKKISRRDSVKVQILKVKNKHGVIEVGRDTLVSGLYDLITLI